MKVTDVYTSDYANSDRIEQYFDLIPGDLFGRRHYQQSYARREKQMVPLKSKRFFRIMQNDCFEENYFLL